MLMIDATVKRRRALFFNFDVNSFAQLLAQEEHELSDATRASPSLMRHDAKRCESIIEVSFIFDASLRPGGALAEAGLIARA